MKRSRSSSDRWVESPKRKAVDIEGPESEETLIDPSQLDPRDEEEAKTTNRTEAEVGIIEKVTLINFMCHRRLDVSLSPNINFVLGRNGSGKSAIMTGIVIALGGNARNTERGRSLKQFIRSGERSSEVRVTLRNQGVDAYHPEKYGSSITVERVIHDDGTGQYRIKNENAGKTVSTKKEELVNILDHCLIQVDNPVSLLNQDTSRHFLQKSKPTDKYKLFMKATQLEQIALDYEKSEQDQEIMKEVISRQRSLLPEYEAEAKELEEKLATFKRREDMEDKVVRLEEELQWALVAEIERGIIPIERSIERDKKKIPKRAKKMKAAEEDVSKWDTAEKMVQEQLNEVVTEADSLTKRRDDLALEKRKIDRNMHELGVKISNILSQLREKKEEKEMLETTRDNFVAMSQRDNTGEKEFREKQLQECRMTLMKLEGEISVAENDRHQFDSAVKRSRDMISGLGRKMIGNDDEIKKVEERLERLLSSHDQQLSMFGRDMQELVHTIQKSCSAFTHLPRGPLGSAIKLCDYTWVTAVEQVITKSMLRAFVVDNHSDGAILRRIIRDICRRGPRPEVIVSPFQTNVFDVRRNRPEVDCLTVLDVLDVRDPNVLNVLIDQCHVESVLLIANRSEANRVIVHERPRGAMSAYTLEGDKVLQHGHYSNKDGKLGILRESVEAAVRDERAKLAELREYQGNLARERNEVEAKARVDEGFVRDALAKVSRKSAEKRKLKEAMEELQNAQEEEEPEEDIATYDSEIAELEEEIKKSKELHLEFGEEKQELNSERLDCFQKSKKIDSEVEVVSSRVIGLKTEMADFAHKKHAAETMVKHYKEQISSIQAAIAELRARVVKEREQAEAAVLAAEEVCPRIETERSCQSIRLEVDKLQRYIEQECPRMEEKEMVATEYLRAMDRFKGTLQIIEDEKDALEKLVDGLKLRRNGYLSLQDRIIDRAKTFFSHFLKQRGYDGFLRFYHSKQRLEIEVKVDRSDEAQVTTNTKALSGGERSFTTVCFVMSLWEAMEAPFRCLDEFDVFMDMINRRVSMKLMLDHAEDNSVRQFIFFTPQDMSSMGIKFESNKLKVLKLDPPERGQTTLRLREH